MAKGPEQLDIFKLPPSSSHLARAHEAEDVTKSYVPPDGCPEFQAAHELLKFVDYIKLNEWQRKVLWPHLRYLAEDLMPSLKDKPQQLQFELGYIVGTMEIEQLRSRSDALKICRKYGIDYLR